MFFLVSLLGYQCQLDCWLFSCGVFAALYARLPCAGGIVGRKCFLVTTFRTLIASCYDRFYALSIPMSVTICHSWFFGVCYGRIWSVVFLSGVLITGSILAAGVKAYLYEYLTERWWYLCSPPWYYPPTTLRFWADLPWNARAGPCRLLSPSKWRGSLPAYRENFRLSRIPTTLTIQVLYRSKTQQWRILCWNYMTNVSINMSKQFHELQVGFGRKVPQILEELNIGWEHINRYRRSFYQFPSRQLPPIKEEEILSVGSKG